MRGSENEVKVKKECSQGKFAQEKKAKIPRKRWSIEEEQVYVEFLKENKKSLEKKKERWFEKIFEQLSYALGKSRNSIQCHAHHESAMKKYGSIDEILRSKLSNMQKKQQPQHSDELSDIEIRIFQQLYEIRAKGPNITIVADINNIEEW